MWIIGVFRLLFPTKCPTVFAFASWEKATNPHIWEAWTTKFWSFSLWLRLCQTNYCILYLIPVSNCTWEEIHKKYKIQDHLWYRAFLNVNTKSYPSFTCMLPYIFTDLYFTVSVVQTFVISVLMLTLEIFLCPADVSLMKYLCFYIVTFFRFTVWILPTFLSIEL